MIVAVPHLRPYSFGLIAFVALFFRSSDLFRHPRFWAEEATFYVARAWQVGAESLFAVINGNYQLVTSALTWLASLVPYRFAPYVTTYGSLAAVIAVAIMFGFALLARNVPFWAVAIFIAGLALQPGGYETFLTATNIQWILSLSMLAMLIMPETRLNPALAYPWVILCGMTGVPSCIMAPVFLVYAVATWSRRHLAIGIILSLCAIVQIVIIMKHGVPGRVLSLDLHYLPLSTFLQTVVTPLVGPVQSDVLAALLRDAGAQQKLLAILVTYVLLSIIAMAAWLPDNRVLSLTIGASLILVTGVQIFGSLNDQKSFVTALGSARYFQFGACCLAVLACMGTASASRMRRLVSAAILVVLLGSAVHAAQDRSWSVFFLTGPRWQSEISQCSAPTCTPGIWPAGWRTKLR
jgi:hypothetical protein